MKLIGVGLNKTGTKTLKGYCEAWGFRHRSYELEAFHRYRAGDLSFLLDEMEETDSFEDWPWPLMYREIDERFPEAKFVLTVRRDPETWYRSLCKMAVRMGPLRDFEKHIYGYAMPQGHRQEHLEIYERHNAEVKAHFADRPGKLLCISWESESAGSDLAAFVGLPEPQLKERHVNASASVYEGDRLWLAHAHRVIFQTRWYTSRWVKARLRPIRNRLMKRGRA